MARLAYRPVWLVCCAALCAGGCSILMPASEVIKTAEKSQVKIDGAWWDAKKMSRDEVIEQRRIQLAQANAEADRRVQQMQAQTSPGAAPVRPATDTFAAAGVDSPGAYCGVSHTSLPPPPAAPAYVSPPGVAAQPPRLATKPVDAAATSGNAPTQTNPPSKANSGTRVRGIVRDAAGTAVAMLESEDGGQRIVRTGDMLRIRDGDAWRDVNVDHISDSEVTIRDGARAMVLP